jgi:ABC-type lipoprotein export system ATPase subunit
MIDIKNLNKKFQTTHGTLTVFDNFNLTVPDGTFLGVQGKSGIGKTTLLSIIAGLQKPDNGTISINETEITNLNEKKLAAFRNQNIGYISQEQSFLENLTVFDNVRLPAYINKHADPDLVEGQGPQIEARVHQLLSNLGIEHLATQYPTELSGGENHRVLIARALINDPKIILADEPTDSVDEERTEEIIKIFHKLADEGKTVVLVSHDKATLKSCDKIINL